MSFGCARCWPEDAALAWEARWALKAIAGLIDESHFIVTLLVCPECTQRFVSIFAETVDWADGEDPQYRTVAPVTESEAAGLVEAGSALSEAQLTALGPDRRSLQRDFPKGGEPRAYWSTGVRIGPHD